MLFDEPVNCGDADPVAVARAEQRPVIRQNDLSALDQVAVDGFAAACAHIDNALFIAFADHTQPVVIHIRQVESDQLRAPDAAVQKDHENRKITRLIGTFDGFQQRRGFFE